ncbi:hypothetical protein GY45DRAFT_635825 [Cubamyces sp. BRFM 1775]|nr:hypothetical protein GY45DRAFT_635825 [Cubamyces sp. BRFM 1775]
MSCVSVCSFAYAFSLELPARAMESREKGDDDRVNGGGARHAASVVRKAVCGAAELSVVASGWGDAEVSIVFCGQSCSGQLDGYHCNQAFLGIPGDGWHSANNAGWFINQGRRLPSNQEADGKLGIDECRGVYTYSPPVPGLLGRTWSGGEGGADWWDALPQTEWRPSVG